MLHMYQYALYYYKYAAALRPTDGRMWCAVGNIGHIDTYATSEVAKRKIKRERRKAER